MRYSEEEQANNLWINIAPELLKELKATNVLLSAVLDELYAIRVEYGYINRNTDKMSEARKQYYTNQAIIAKATGAA